MFLLNKNKKTLVDKDDTTVYNITSALLSVTYRFASSCSAKKQIIYWIEKEKIKILFSLHIQMAWTDTESLTTTRLRSRNSY